ncbi:MAG: type IX secretion system protein PorQ [Taibaiella sp.]|nr:type IX secretion system protein PorQ [Taibaiella sp.]
MQVLQRVKNAFVGGSNNKAAKALLLGLAITGSSSLLAQVTGGQFAFEFLRLSNSPRVSALGGISVANPSPDISLAVQNPALMRPGLHNQLQLNYNGLYAGMSSSNLNYGYHSEKLNTSFVGGLQYMNYGNFKNTTAAGTVEGDFKAVDYAFSFGASRSYGEHWRYGANVKFAHSALYNVRASAAMIDVGVNYYDTASLWDIGVVAKNMGVMLDKYTDVNPAEPIPFDLQFGVSKQFKHLPLRLFSTIHHLYEWDIRYSNPEDVTANTLLGTTDSNQKTKRYFANKLFRHFIFGAEITLGKKVTVTGAYNVLRRNEMALQTVKGVAGFSFGVNVDLNKFIITYGRSYYHIAGPYHEIGITMRMNKLMGLGGYGEKIHWNADHPDW